VVAGLRPGSSIVLSGETLRRRGYRTLGQALADLVGFDLQHTSDGPRYGMRGIPDGVTLVVDGVSLAVDGERDRLDVDSGLDLADIERVEVVRGPASAIGGVDSLSGVVRVTTRKPGLCSARLMLGGTQLGEQEVGGAVSLRHDRLAARVVARHRRGQSSVWRLSGVPTRYIAVGPAILPSTKINTEIAPDDDSATTARLVLESYDLTTDLSYVRTSEHVPISSFSHGLLPSGEQQRRFHEGLRLRLRGDGQIWRWRLAATAFGGYHRRDSRSRLYPTGGAFPAGGRIEVDGDVWVGGLHARLDLPLTADHRLVAGVLGEIARQRAQTDAFDPTTDEATHDLVSFEDFGGRITGALEYQGDFGRGWHLTAGLATRWHAGFGLTALPRAAVVYVPKPWLSLRAAYAEGSRAPDRYDMAGLTQAVVDGRVVGARENDDLDLEHSRTAELGLRLEPSPRIRFDLDGFFTRHEDALEPTTEGMYLVPRNLPARHLLGGELQARGDILAQLLVLEASLSVARIVDGEPLDSDLFVSTANLALTPLDGLTLGARARLSCRWRDDVARGVSVISSVFASYAVVDTFEVRFAARNIFDDAGASPDLPVLSNAPPLAIPGPGRVLFVALEVRR
jgi:outer membrane receptor protein involved in Fe transport